MSTPSEYLAVLKASYDYEPQSEDEIAIKEEQVLLLVEKVDDDWWKVKVKDATEEEIGLVPAAYVEKADPKSVVKAVYDYDAGAPGELSVKEDDVLYVFDKEDEWLLVQNEKEEGKVGFIPGNYVEETDGEGAAASAAAEEEEAEEPSEASQIVVPPSPPRPTSTYVDPADRVAHSVQTVQADSIQTWAVSEVDKKGKKKKGTLGIGNGAIFFASESDKTPVQKWQTSDIESSRIDKSKHVHIEVGGASPTSLHFNAGSKDTAEAIIAKLETSKRAASSSSQSARSSPQPTDLTNGDSKPKKNGVSVHFASAPPSIISPREPSDMDGGEEEEEFEHVEAHAEDDGMLRVTALYDFSADGEDELSMTEGERLILLEKDGEEWWKVRNTDGVEGVVPAQYVELDDSARELLGETKGKTSQATDQAAEAEREAEEQEREEAERREREEAAERKREADRKRAESERRARAAKAATEAAEADRKRKEREQRQREEEEEAEEAAKQKDAEAERERNRSASAARTPRTSSATGSKPSRSDSKASDEKSTSPNKSRADGKTRPSPQRTRVWHDITGQFSVEAEFLAYANGKLRLHKVNGVVIEVPAAKMSPEDLRYVDRVTGKGKRQTSPGHAQSDDDEPLAVRRRSLQPEPKQTPKSTSPPKKEKPIDWFEFFLGAGCELDDCTRYASSFERDKMDASLLPDITEQTMRSLGLREGDIIRVTKAIAQRAGGTSGKKDDSAVKEQMRRDEELARQLQAEEGGGRRQTTSSPAPNLFAAPGGQLKSTRRGRPQPSKSTPPATVDLSSIATASEHINRVGSPMSALTTSPTSLQPPPRAASAAPVVSGFDDDAWTNRPSSTKPIAPTPPAVQARAPSAPPSQTIAPPAPTPPPVPPVPAVTTAPAMATAVSAPASIPSATTSPSITSPTATVNSLARTTTSDVFDQLARLSALKTQSPQIQQPPPMASSPATTVSPPPVGFHQGLGMGSSPSPMGSIQVQPTGYGNPGPRGPFAPVPQNQGLLQPLVPTTTGFNGFIPARPASNPLPFQATGFQAPTQPSSFQPPQQNSFLSPQGNFGGPIAPQPTGYVPNSGPMMSQPTGYGASPFGGGVPFNAAANRPVGSLQPAMTGFNPNFGQMSAPPPPVPPLPPSLNNNNVNSTAPANVFASMKAGTFGKDDAPQPSVKYDALRPQPTGWGTFQNGFQGQYY